MTHTRLNGQKMWRLMQQIGDVGDFTSNWMYFFHGWNPWKSLFVEHKFHWSMDVRWCKNCFGESWVMQPWCAAVFWTPDPLCSQESFWGDVPRGLPEGRSFRTNVLRGFGFCRRQMDSVFLRHKWRNISCHIALSCIIRYYMFLAVGWIFLLRSSGAFRFGEDIWR